MQGAGESSRAPAQRAWRVAGTWCCAVPAAPPRLTSSTVGFTVGMAHRRDPVGAGELCVWRYPLLYEDAAVLIVRYTLKASTDTTSKTRVVGDVLFRWRLSFTLSAGFLATSTGATSAPAAALATSA